MDNLEPDVYNLTVLGASGVGKSSIIYGCDNINSQKPTEGAQFCPGGSYVKELDKSISFNIWDTGGKEKFRPLVKSFCKKSKICVLVYDITNRNSLNEVNYWINELKLKSPHNYGN